jgi:hypothetical protein
VIRNVTFIQQQYRQKTLGFKKRCEQGRGGLSRKKDARAQQTSKGMDLPQEPAFQLPHLQDG